VNTTAVGRELWIMINPVADNGEDRSLVGERYPSTELAARLREAVGRPLDEWREVYESFSPVDAQTGERRPRVPPPGADSRRAAVLVPVLLEPEGARLVYTVRKGHLQDHAGQISFPGGSLDPADGSLLQTALREASEEIDLSPNLVEVIGELEEMYIPPSNFRVSPFVGLLPPEAELVLAPDEVEEIFTASLDELMAAETLRKVLWTREGRDYEVPVFAVDGPPPREIWGATAAMTAALLARLGWTGYRAPLLSNS
jgi:8-oxo-dGTP pyrophosphatase MutT (NUDIX family)